MEEVKGVSSASERERVQAAVEKLSSGSKLLGSFDGVSKVWLVENCRMIPTQADSRALFVIGDREWDTFVLLTVAGDLGYHINIADFKLVVASVERDQCPASLREARIEHVGWAKVFNGSLGDL